MGERCAAANLFLGTPLVPYRLGIDLPYRVRFTLAANRRSCRQQRYYPDRNLLGEREIPDWTRSPIALADVVLDQFEQFLSPFPLWWRGCAFRSAHCPGRASDFGRTAFHFLSL